LSMDEFVGFDLLTGVNVEIAFVDFYRELILKRLLANLLCTTHYDNQ
jgi:hypothetical protein